MSSPLAIAAVTAALKDLLNNGLMDHDLSTIGSFSVTALPPDRITTGQTEPNQLNLFLYQVTPNLGWRNAGLPSHDRTGVRLSAPPLALDLHYLLTAYGSQDLNAEVLLGYAMQLLHETPVLSRTQLRTVLGAPTPIDGTIGGASLPSIFGNLSAIDLADQIELIKITPVFLSTEDLSKMWTAMQARFRMAVGYMASVVLIQATNNGRSAPPVLKRGAADTGPTATTAPMPSLTSVRPEISDLLPAMRLGDDLVVSGISFVNPQFLSAVLENSKSNLPQQSASVEVISPTRLRVHVPGIAEDADAMHEWAVGLYKLALLVAQPGLPVLPTGGVYIALAPIITVTPLSAPAGNINLTVKCTPRLLPEQEAQTSLIFGYRPVLPTSITTDPNDPKKPTILTFTVPGVVAGEYMVRLRVEGIDSLPVIVSGSPAQLDLDPSQKVTVA